MELLSRMQKKEETILTLKDSWKISQPKEKQGVMYSSDIGILVTIAKNTYSSQDPHLNEEEKRTLSIMSQGLYELLNFEEGQDPELFLQKAISLIITELDLRLSQESFERIYFFMYKEFIGLGKIEAIKRDPLVTKILYKGKEETIKIEHRIYGTLNTEIILNKEERESILKHILISYNKEIPEEIQEVVCENEKEKWKMLWKGEESAFLCAKKQATISSPRLQ